jgi:hypothetical protein
MGRGKKYHTDEERRAANNEKVKRFYWANKEECDRKARERYWKKKLEDVPSNGHDTEIQETKQVIEHINEQQ